MSGGEVRLLGCPGLSDPLTEVQTATGACLGGWAEVVVEGARLSLQLESSWEEVWRLEAALETLLGAGQEPGLDGGRRKWWRASPWPASTCALPLGAGAACSGPTRPGPWTSSCWTAAEW